MTHQERLALDEKVIEYIDSTPVPIKVIADYCSTYKRCDVLNAV